jgi:hypothetical protein
MGAPTTPSYMRFFRDLLLTAIVLTVVVLLVEMGLRIAGVKYEASFYTAEAERGYALRPNAEGWSVLENENYVRINSAGMYDKERANARPPDLIRIAVIGASEAEAQQVPLHKTFEAVVERQLSGELAHSGRHAEVLNFAVPGYSLAQQYLTLHNHVWKYQPQIVVLTITAYTVLRNTRVLYPGPTQGSPFYVFDHGRLVPDRETGLAHPPDPGRLKWTWRFANWMNKSRILSLVNEVRVRTPGLLDRIEAQMHLRTSSRTVMSSDVPLNYLSTWPYNPRLPQMRQSWEITDAFFKMMKEDCDQHSAELWIVVAGMEAEVYPDLSNRQTLQQRIGVNSLLQSDEYIEEMAHADGIHVVLLAPAMGEFAVSHHVALHGFFNTSFNHGHWNETGHEVAGFLIAQALLRNSDVLGSQLKQPAFAVHNCCK